jgi:squalene-hopene/tetraprenyl-beta-curcumene cyclase
MYDSTLDGARLIDEVCVRDLDGSVQRAADALMAAQRPDGHFVFELEADATIPSEYILLRQYLGEPDDLELERKLGVYIRRVQGEHGGWPLYHGGPLDISATVKAYFALKMIGDDPDAPHMVRARQEILARGGMAAANVFTRIQLALYGEVSWFEIPNMPAELVLAPRWFPISLARMSYWSRTVIVPLLVLMHLKPRAQNPRCVHVGELFKPAAKSKRKFNAADTKLLWTLGFNALDAVLKATDRFWPRRLRARAIQHCVAWVVERLNGEDGLGAIYPAMANSVMMFDALGYAEDHPHRAIARKSVENLLVVKDDEAYCQPCVSPIWDTALASHALMEAGGPAAEGRTERALGWLRGRQVLDVKGDWADMKPDVRPGGWAFQYNNAHYPDLDDTAVVVMAMDRARQRLGVDGNDEAIARGEEWVAGLQSKDGGFAAFDADNTHFYLNNIPFADHGALLDPPTVDVAARCVGMLAQLGEPLDSPRMSAAITYLRGEQEADGSFWGRWGVNYIYGTWSALVALNKAGVEPTDPLMRKAVDWLVSIQQADGGWGESCDSYKLDYKGYEPAAATSSQTAWALLALMSAGEADHPAVAKGIKWLQAHQDDAGLWPEEFYTGGGFPRVFYLRYHGYRKFFPLWALARYRNLMKSNTREVEFGI